MPTFNNNTNNTNVNATAPVAAHDDLHQPGLLQAAVARVAADLAAIPDAELESPNLVVETVVTVALGALTTSAPYIPQLEKMVDLDVGRIKRLRDFVDALMYWQGSATFAETPRPELGSMVERGLAIRETVLHDLGSLVRHEVLPANILGDIGSSVAYRMVARDLIALSNLVHERWPSLEGKTLITLAAMDEAQVLAQKILQAIGDRDAVRAAVASAVRQRNKAFVLVTSTYSELRQAMLYLRRKEGDADKIVPSFYAGRRTKRSGEDDASVEAASAASPVAKGADHDVHSSLLDAEDASS